MTFVLTGLDIEEKAQAGRGDALEARRRHASSSPRRTCSLRRGDRPDPAATRRRSRTSTVAVKDPDAQKVGRAFSQQGRRDGARELPRLLHDEPAGRRSSSSASTGRRWCRRRPVEHAWSCSATRRSRSRRRSRRRRLARRPRACAGAARVPGGADARRAARHDLRRALGRQGRQRQRRRLGADARGVRAGSRSYLTVERLRAAAAARRASSRSSATSCRTCWRSTSSCTACSATASPRRCAAIRRRRASASTCAPSSCRSRCRCSAEF